MVTTSLQNFAQLIQRTCMACGETLSVHKLESFESTEKTGQDLQLRVVLACPPRRGP